MPMKKLRFDSCKWSILLIRFEAFRKAGFCHIRNSSLRVHLHPRARGGGGDFGLYRANIPDAEGRVRWSLAHWFVSLRLRLKKDFNKW